MRVGALAASVVVVVLLTACVSENPVSPTHDRGTPTIAFGVNGNSDNASWVLKETGRCGMPGSDAAGNIIFGGVGVVETKVENNNKVTIICKGTTYLKS